MGRFVETYFKTASAPPIAEIRATLWAKEDQPGSEASQIMYSSAILEQYKLYVEMADRASARRGLANTFFLTLNTAAISAIGILWSNRAYGPKWTLTFLFVGLIIQCLAWYWLLRSYRQLNTAKYAVVGALEERLPASPYWAAEWAALGEGKDPARYWPLSHLEQWIPTLFVLVYLFGLIASLATR
jgi:hypothetical protein